MARFPIDDLDPNLTQEARDVICDLTLAWASYDTMISYWMILTFGLEMDVGSILLGNMDTKSKLDRMKLLCDHLGFKGSVDSIARLQKSHLEFVEARNALMHRRCIGMTHNDDCERLVFTSVKHIRRDIGNFELLAFDLNMFKTATNFANEAVDKIMKITKPLALKRDADEARRKEQSEQSREG